MARRPRGKIEEVRQRAEGEIKRLWDKYREAHQLDEPSEHDAFLFFGNLQRDRPDLVRCWKEDDPWQRVHIIVESAMYPAKLRGP